jgi:hypothetical protein
VKPVHYQMRCYNALMDVAELSQMEACIRHKVNCLAYQMIKFL